MSQKQEKTGTETFNINFVDPEFKVVEEDDYCVAMTNYSISKTGEKSKTPGVPMIVCTFTIMEGEQKGTQLPPHNFVVAESSQRFISAFLLSIGVIKEKPKDGTPIKITPAEWMNKPCMANVTVATYESRGEDKLKNEIKYFFPI